MRDSGPSFILNPKCLPGETWKWAICTTYVVQPKTAATSSLHGPKQFAILDHLLHVERLRDKWLNILFNTVWPDCFWTIAYTKQGYETAHNGIIIPSFEEFHICTFFRSLWWYSKWFHGPHILTIRRSFCIWIFTPRGEFLVKRIAFSVFAKVMLFLPCNQFLHKCYVLSLVFFHKRLDGCVH